MYTLYFADKVTVFAGQNQTPEGKTLHLPAGERITRAQILEHMAGTDRLTVLSPRPEELFAAFASGFTSVEAAGGVVENDRGQWLLIFRNGKWDLPKGHLESGESLPLCAAREVSEECGLEAGSLSVGRFICATHHFYHFPRTSRWELKRTFWFRIHYSGTALPRPQREEGIERVEWMSPEKARKAVAGSFRTIADVIEKTTNTK